MMGPVINNLSSTAERTVVVIVTDVIVVSDSQLENVDPR